MEKNNKLLTIVIILMIVIISLFVYVNFGDKIVGARSSVSSVTYSGNWTNVNVATTSNELLVATSTNPSLGDASYRLAGAASTTVIYDIASAQDITLSLFMNSTSTAPVFQANYYFTNDTVASTTGWYAETADATTAGVTTHTPIVMQTLTGTAAQDYYLLDVPDLGAKKFKIEYTVIGAATDILLDINYN